MIKSVTIYDIDDSSMVVDTDDFGGLGGLGAVDSVNGQTGDVVLTQDNIGDGTTNKQYTSTEKTKLAGIQSGATANSTDAQLRDRTTHTGSQAISTITNLQTTLDGKQSISEKGQVNGYASLDGLGKVPSSQLPSYVDDVIEVADFASLPVTGETGKIYTTIDNNKSYRWGGSSYTPITDGKATWGGIDGLISNQTDLQTALDNKVNKNIPITGATKTKITYDSKGMVISGEDATTADIADSINKRYVTDADLIDIGNLSGINTGDETKATIESKLTGDITSHTHGHNDTTGKQGGGTNEYYHLSSGEYNQVKNNTQKMYINLTYGFSPVSDCYSVGVPLSGSKTFTSYLKGTFVGKNSMRIKFDEN